MTRQEKIEDKLTKALNPTVLRVLNESHLHAGHAGDDGSGESHFKIEISSDVFDGESRIARNRMVYNALGDEMKKIHALSIVIL